MKLDKLLSLGYEDGYELWIEKEGYHFRTLKEAYVYYLKHFATKEDFEYYKDCAGKDLKDIADNDKLIGMVFENVFNQKHHVYKLQKRNGKIERIKV